MWLWIAADLLKGLSVMALFCKSWLNIMKYYFNVCHVSTWWVPQLNYQSSLFGDTLKCIYLPLYVYLGAFLSWFVTRTLLIERVRFLFLYKLQLPFFLFDTRRHLLSYMEIDIRIAMLLSPVGLACISVLTECFSYEH